MSKGLSKLENDLFSQDNSSEQPPSDIVSFNELRSCSDLKRMKETEQLLIDPDFQRNFIWSAADQTRFIDSLVMQLPIPSMCISYDYKTDKRLMIDGLQRISTVIKFLSDKNWRLSKLEDIDKKISGKTVEEIKSKLPAIYSRIENLTIPITVIRCDYSKKSHMDYLFKIFHRLNSQGSKLNNQEIRNCIFFGSFNNFLKDTVKKEPFKSVFGKEKGSVQNKSRFVHEELLLRIIAHHAGFEEYDGKLSAYLNDFMRKIRDQSIETSEKIYQPIFDALNIIQAKIIKNGKPLKLSKTVMESLVVGVSRNIKIVSKMTDEEIIKRYNTMLSDQHFSQDALKEGLAAKEKVISRLKTSIKIFS